MSLGRKSPYRPLLAVLLALSSSALALPAAAGASSTARAAKNCTAPKYPGSGYFTSLAVSHVTCAQGAGVTRAHYRCRVKHGPAGRCSSRVMRYRCSERRQSISTEIDAVVTCRRGSKKVVYSYQQNT